MTLAAVREPQEAAAAPAVPRRRTGLSFLAWLALGLAWSASLALVLPTIGKHIGDPNRIVYFNADEGGQMDLVWWNYSGVKRDSFQWEYDYGLELVYLADLARLALSRVMTVRPGTFVLILRWVHLLSWLLALGAFWRFIGCHFGRGWRQAVGVLLLATRPAFAYFSNNLKPEPLVLLLIIAGLDATLRLLDPSTRAPALAGGPRSGFRPAGVQSGAPGLPGGLHGLSARRIALAAAYAALAVVIKYAGVFLLPAVVCAVYLAERGLRREGRPPVTPRLAHAWVIYAGAGAALILLPIAAVLFYVRNSTGRTWYADHGFWGSVAANRGIGLLWLLGAGLIACAMALWALERSGQPRLRWLRVELRVLNSITMVVCGAFLGFTALFGFRWFISPQYFLRSYTALVGMASESEALEMIGTRGLLAAFLDNVAAQIGRFDTVLFALLAAYAAVELAAWRRTPGGRARRAKRLVLACFLAPWMAVTFSMFHFAQHHMLLCVPAVAALALEGAAMLTGVFAARPALRRAAAGTIGVLLLIDLAGNGEATVRSRLRQFHQDEDVSVEVAAWVRRHIPREERIVADFYTRVYIPPDYSRVAVFKGFQVDRVDQLRRLVDTHRPAFLYYNAGPSGSTPLPPVEEMLPGRRLALVQAFDGRGRTYQRHEDDRFVIYRFIE